MSTAAPVSFSLGGRYTAMVGVDTTPVMAVPFHSSGPRFGLSPGGVPGQTFMVSAGSAPKPEMPDARHTVNKRAEVC